jgi:hypothetical protein
MNPSGISYFYGSEDMGTCKKEVRPKPGEHVIYGQFRTKRELSIIDLSEKVFIGAKSVFDPDYDHAYNWASSFVESFVEEISKPIDPAEAPIEYMPTQILCEYIRKLGYDGVAFNREETTKREITWGLKFVHPNQVPEFTEWLSLSNFKEERV